MPEQDVELTALTSANEEQDNLKKANQEAANQDAQQAAEAGAQQMSVKGDQKPEATDEAQKSTPKPQPGGKGDIKKDDTPERDYGAGSLNPLADAFVKEGDKLVDKLSNQKGALPFTDKSANELGDGLMQKGADFINQAKESLGGGTSGGGEPESESPTPDGEVKPQPDEGIELQALSSDSEDELDLGQGKQGSDGLSGGLSDGNGPDIAEVATNTL